MRHRDADLAGLDAVRLFATGLVTTQHALTLVGHEDRATVAGLSVGQIGVAAFLAVSGLLASESRRPPVAWLAQRFRRLYPAYWVAVGASFVLAGVVGHKSFGAGQVAAQLAGVGLFTHGDNLVNTPTWFVSLLLVCYAGSFLARLTRAPLLAGGGASVALAVLVAVVPHPWLVAHLFTYALTSTVAQAGRARRPAVAVLAAGVLLALAVWVQRAFGYAAVALVVVELSLALRTVPRLVRVAAGYTYEYFLIHGLALYGVLRLMPAAPWVAVGCAVVLAAGAAIVLHSLVEVADEVVTRRSTPGPKPPQTAAAVAVHDPGSSGPRPITPPAEARPGPWRSPPRHHEPVQHG